MSAVLIGTLVGILIECTHHNINWGWLMRPSLKGQAGLADQHAFTIKSLRALRLGLFKQAGWPVDHIEDQHARPKEAFIKWCLIALPTN